MTKRMLLDAKRLAADINKVFQVLNDGPSLSADHE